MTPMTYDELQRRFPPGQLITGGSRRWRVQIPIGRDPETGKKLHHHKSIRGSKKDAQAYVDWITGLLNSGQAVTATVSQSELGELRALQEKADRFRATLQAAVRDGAIVELGALELPAPAAGVILPEKLRPRAAPTSKQGFFRPLFR